ncbi:Protein of unknown function [Bacillus mycoides]|nr:Protein of unknown function [Bacillus mycoides]
MNFVKLETQKQLD